MGVPIEAISDDVLELIFKCCFEPDVIRRFVRAAPYEGMPQGNTITRDRASFEGVLLVSHAVGVTWPLIWHLFGVTYIYHHFSHRKGSKCTWRALEKHSSISISYLVIQS